MGKGDGRRGFRGRFGERRTYRGCTPYDPYVSQISDEEHYARAGHRHYRDAVYLHDDDRLPNADYHYGFAVECALKSLLLRFTHVTMIPPKSGRRTSPRPGAPGSDGKVAYFGHLPQLWSDVALMLHGRTGSTLAGLLNGSAPFDTWSVDHRYRDGEEISEMDVFKRRSVAERILGLHQQALIAGVI